MKGTILDYSNQNQGGVISAESGARYKFNRSDFKSESTPQKGQGVDFMTDENGSASEIYSISSAPQSDGKMSSAMKKSIIAVVCAVIAFFVPLIGIVLSIAGLIIGRQARAAAKKEGDETASTVALVAIVISGIAIVFAILTAFALMTMGGSLFM